MEILPIIDRNEFDRVSSNIKKLVKVMRPDIDFDSCFSIHPYWNDGELERIFEEKSDLFKDEFFETREDMAFAVNDAIFRGDINDEYPIIDGIEITANNHWNKELADALEIVSNNMFDSIDFYF